MDTKKWLLLILIPHFAMAQTAPMILPYPSTTQYSVPYTSSYSYSSAPATLPYYGGGSSLFGGGSSLFNSTGSLFSGMQAPVIAPFQSNPFNNGFNSPYNSPVMAPYMNAGGMNPFMSGGAISPFMMPRGPQFAPYRPFGPMRPPFGRPYMMPPYGSGYGSNGNGMLGLLAIGALALVSAFGHGGGGLFHSNQPAPADIPPVAPPPVAPASASNQPAQLDDGPEAAPAAAPEVIDTPPQAIREGRANGASAEPVQTSAAPAELPAEREPAPPSPKVAGPKVKVAAPPRQTVEQKRVDIPTTNKKATLDENSKTEAAAPGTQTKVTPSENCKYGDASMSQACEEINQLRRQNGLKDFALNAEMNAVALKYAQDLAKQKADPNKIDPKEIGKRLGKAHVKFKNIGAKSGGLNVTVEKDYHAAVQHWMKTEQKENLLSPNFTRIGIGESKGYWVFIGITDEPTAADLAATKTAKAPASKAK